MLLVRPFVGLGLLVRGAYISGQCCGASMAGLVFYSASSRLLARIRELCGVERAVWYCKIEDIHKENGKA